MTELKYLLDNSVTSVLASIDLVLDLQGSQYDKQFLIEIWTSWALY